MQSKTIAVIGGINRDEIRMVDGTLRRGWGGILYNITALRKYGSPNLTIYPIAFVGRDATTPVGHWLNGLPGVDCSGLIPLNRKGNLCKLRYRDAQSRDERLLHVVPSLKFSHVPPALGADIILMNFISGSDISHTAFERLRTEFDGPIYLDIHSYLLGRHRDASRFSRRPKNWRRVLACADFLQMNEIEFATLSGTAPSPDSVRNWARSVLTPLRCRCLLVTLGARGAFCAVRTGTGWKVNHCPAGPRPRGADPTGAGDVFAGAWIASWLDGQDPVKATRAAARIAARHLVMDV